MSRIEDLLAKALLVRSRPVPRDIVPPSTPHQPSSRPAIAPTAQRGAPGEAAEDLRALCETFVTHTPATAVADFITEQVPEPRSALVLACVLQLTDTEEGARFWWQYAAGAGQAAAAYCLYLHHLAAGEVDTARWWHRQTDDVQALPKPPEARDRQHDPQTTPAWHPAGHPVTSTSTSTILRILRHLAKNSPRRRTATVTALMAYLPIAVASGYLREPDADLPLPGPDFADRITGLLTEAARRPNVSDTLPARHTCREGAPRKDCTESVSPARPAALPETARR